MQPRGIDRNGNRMLTAISPPLRRQRRHAQRGLSLVELLVGIAVGLFVVAGAAMMTGNQLADNRRMLSEAQVQQDLRAAVDIMTREVRRSGARRNPHTLVSDGAGTGSNPGTIDDITPSIPGSATTFRYERVGTSSGALGYRLQGTAVQTRMPALGSAAAFQDLTDTRSMAVESLTITPMHTEEPTPAGPAPSRLPCTKLCPDGTSNCWPLIRVRALSIDVQARAVHDASVRRALSTVVHPRNNELVVVGSTICPA